MKRFQTAFLIFFLAGASVQSVHLMAQCNADSHCTTCVSKVPEGFNFLKSYKVDGMGGQKNKIEYSYVLTSGTQYAINICTGTTGTDGIIVSLFDASRRQIATSKIDNKFLNQITLICGATGIYYIQYTFEGSKAFCGGSALAYKR